MANLTGMQQVSGTNTLYPSATQQHALGARMQLKSGRVFRYCLAGAVDLVAGNVIQSAAPVANHINCTLGAAAVGATQLTVTPGATAGAANLYEEGIAVVSTGPNLGQTFSVSGHAAITASVAFLLNLFSDDPNIVALTSSSKLDLIQNTYRNVIQTPVTTLTGIVVGVAPVIIPAGYFGWLQTWDACGVLIDGTPAVGQIVSAPAAVAGGAAINSGTLGIVGEMMVVGVDTKCKPVFLKIAA